jgi:dCMP deaminase
MRPSKWDYYINIALEVAKRGTCTRRNYGAVIVKHDEIISTGYTGAPRGKPHCSEATCKRTLMGIKAGERYELCRSVHAEQNAIISAARRDMQDADIYVAGIDRATGMQLCHWPCLICKKLIINAGIKQVFIRDSCISPLDWEV